MSERRFQKNIPAKKSIELSLEDAGYKSPEHTIKKFKSKGKQLSDNGEQNRRQVVNTVLDTDPYAKALTGRTPERLEKETGIDKDELFPKEKDIIYVGDPWQRMGLELDNGHMFIIDYQFGEAAEFINNQEYFLENVLGEDEAGMSEELVQEIKYWLQSDDLTDSQRQWLNHFYELVNTANRLTLKANENNLDDYEKIASAWQQAREYIQATYQREISETEEDLPTSVADPEHEYNPLANFRKNSWYNCIYIERGFRDIPVWFNQIKPKIDKQRIELKKQNASKQEIEEQLKKLGHSLINKYSLYKKTKEAHVIQAIFPELPFEDESFDRLIASWSISAHAFTDLDKQGFTTCWEEIYRVLKKGGKAYIFPLTYSNIDEDVFFNSLEEFCKKTTMNWDILDDNGLSVNKQYLDETLLLEKN
jgi:SAM-dependent methyltransferase